MSSSMRHRPPISTPTAACARAKHRTVSADEHQVVRLPRVGHVSERPAQPRGRSHGRGRTRAEDDDAFGEIRTEHLGPRRDLGPGDGGLASTYVIDVLEVRVA